jgi:VanZ family protein
MMVKAYYERLTRLRRADARRCLQELSQSRLASAVTILLRALAWLLIVLISALSLLPSFRPVTGAPHNVEHFSIFLMTGLTFGLGYSSRHLYQAVGLVIFTGAIEIAQHWIPGRHARTSDFVVDATSACLGVAAAWLIIKITAYLIGSTQRDSRVSGSREHVEIQAATLQRPTVRQEPSQITLTAQLDHS